MWELELGEVGSFPSHSVPRQPGWTPGLQCSAHASLCPAFPTVTPLPKAPGLPRGGRLDWSLRAGAERSPRPSVSSTPPRHRGADTLWVGTGAAHVLGNESLGVAPGLGRRSGLHPAPTVGADCPSLPLRPSPPRRRRSRPGPQNPTVPTACPRGTSSLGVTAPCLSCSPVTSAGQLITFYVVRAD